MGLRRRLHALAAAVGLVLALVAALGPAGCGSSGTKTSESTSASPPGAKAPASARTRDCAASAREASDVRATSVSCSTAAEVAAAWKAERGCTLSANASRGACTVGRYRCLSISTDRGLAVACARPGHSISFFARRG